MQDPSSQKPAATETATAPHVLIVGAGAAGMAAATRLLQRGFDVTLIEQNDFLGGKLGAHSHPVLRAEPVRAQDAGTGTQREAGLPPAGAGPIPPDMHEHCYHMYLNWYHNFWTLMDEIGALGKWIPMPVIGYRRPGSPQTEAYLTNAGSPWTILKNLATGAASPADLFLYSYSLLDLLGQPSGPDSTLEQNSVAGFLQSRGYSTAGSMGTSFRTLAEAFASPSYLSSTRSYQSLIKYGFRQPSPSLWLLTQNTQEAIFGPWEAHLHALAGKLGRTFVVERHKQLDRLHLKDGRIEAVTVSSVSENPTTERGKPAKQHHPARRGVSHVILAVPPGTLGRLVTRDIAEIAPGLADVRRLRSEPMISLDLYFKRKIPGLTQSITLLLDSRNNLSLLDNSQLWGDGSGPTFLNVIASDADTLVDYGSDDIRDILLRELRRYLDFRLGDPACPADQRDDDIDYGRTHLQTNVGEELFVNQVGSWDYRPRAVCPIPNLFIAGDYCQTFVDVVTIEGAVVSGLNAAEALRASLGVGEPIEIIVPPSYPAGAMAAAASIARPLAFAAKAVSTVESGARGTFGTLFPNG